MRSKFVPPLDSLRSSWKRISQFADAAPGSRTYKFDIISVHPVDARQNRLKRIQHEGLQARSNLPGDTNTQTGRRSEGSEFTIQLLKPKIIFGKGKKKIQSIPSELSHGSKSLNLIYSFKKMSMNDSLKKTPAQMHKRHFKMKCEFVTQKPVS